MAEQKKRGRTSGMSVLLMLLLIIVGAAGAVGTILILGNGSLFAASGKDGERKDAQDAEDHTGKVAVFICARPIEVYAAVEREHLINPATKDFAVKWIETEKAKQAKFIIDLKDLQGRVLSHDKEPGYAFTEGDFFPKGTKAGPAAGVKAGHRGLWIDPKEVQGLDNLGRGERFDLVATTRLKSQVAKSDPRFVSPEADRASADADAWKSSQRVIVNGGEILVALPKDPMKRKGRSLFVQVAEGEVEGLTNAIAVGAELVVYSRSSRPDGAGTDLPSPAAPAEMDSIEVIQGGKTQIVPVPASGSSNEAGQDPK